MLDLSDLKYLTVELKEAATVVFVNRPQALNALNKEVLGELDYAMTVLSEGRNAIPLIITGGGAKAFVAGADIEEMADMTREEAAGFSRFGHRVFSKIEKFPSPTIAAVNGYALGGGNELALACDIRIASEKAKFGQPEVGLGIIPGFGGTQRLVRVVGEANALDLIFTGRSIDAQEAFRIGLVHKVVPADKLLDEAFKYVEDLRKNSAFAMSQAKKAIYKWRSDEVEPEMDLEVRLFAQCFDHPDQKEGMGAFVEKRSPSFRKDS
ncbi:MAG: enoyl-CoA hydratase-related protein [Bacillota bacterium]|nr:crotonase [Candidatus Fermentithermobacillaceae bacterium]HOK64545.1 enoyl-CoA hydratase-related protein [Bacillota bacterium]HOQ03106.1 enoyl-CoA hydratase-related protein [Bacillota bacterium]